LSLILNPFKSPFEAKERVNPFSVEMEAAPERLNGGRRKKNVRNKTNAIW